jgi:glycosyltransferase involved in cell wall biosynthesis
MHILAAARSLPFHSFGGMQGIAWDLLTEFARRGHRVTVLTTRIPRRLEPFVEQGVRVIPLQHAPPERYSDTWWRESRRFAETRLSHGVDAVLSVSVAAAGLLPLKRSGLRVPFLCQLHGSSWGEAVSKWRTGSPLEWCKSLRNLYWFVKDAGIYPGFDELILVGDGLLAQFTQAPTRWIAGGTPKTVISNGIDAELFRPDPAARVAVRNRFGWSDGDRVAVFAARLHAQKGAAAAIRAVARLRREDPACRLLIIGGGPAEMALRNLASALDCRSAVHFTGAVARSEVPALLSAGDAFVFPTLRSEGLPLNVLEALAVGLPCVCSSVLQQALGTRLPVRYAPSDDLPQLAAALRAALERGATRGSLLPATYGLRHCADAYTQRFEALREG